MNLHSKAVIDEIRKKNPSLPFSYLVSESFINKYFPIDLFGSEKLSNQNQKEFNRRLLVALEDAISVYKSRRTISFVILPFSYFFGSIIRDLLIDYADFYEGDFPYYAIWIFWIFLFIFLPVAFAVQYYYESKAIREFIDLELQSIIVSDTGTKINDLSDKKIDYKKRLKELNDLLNEGLISQSEYDKKRKLIIKDL